ncbi:DNA mismatch repair protein MutS [Macrococcus brunensis]|uniref:DNA mismatch repair protein MutS n=1 Tax=Macrococcus brunensis TaxID=198483 RepID=A0A4R6BBY6_9STAP|nr:DNA mismatch repair protein MutS [Macrococcus brunensis]TDL95336.1 DNA mismatch repair protein MutS [Macrococcus brunensis]ULG75209.1 DNA mismatch repair protein MutS [Macrococcus brunensis]
MKPTPMMAQYLEIKSQHDDCILFFRLGDFYEMFYDDAVTAARELEITLTRRDKKNPIPMCGVPYHSAKGYIEKLIDKGYKVAICEQMENPREVKGMVKREVVQIITPGTVMDGSLDESSNNYLMAILKDRDYHIAYADISTGELKVTTCTEEILLNELASIKPSEIILREPLTEELLMKVNQITTVVSVHAAEGTVPEQAAGLTPLAQEVTALLFDYVTETQKRDLTHIEQAAIYQAIDYMRLDLYAKRNLELTESIRLKTKKGTLLSIFNETKTPMGHRLQKEWIERPLINETAITHRHEQVELLNDRFIERDALREHLAEVYDIERLVGRVSFGNANAKDLIQLKYSVEQLPKINQVLQLIGLEQIDDRQVEGLNQMLDALEEEAPISIKDGGIFKTGYHEELDEYRDASKNGKQWLSQMQQAERERTGVRSLKVAFNKVFGYYIEISKANLHQFNADEFGYMRKQTLTNAERFITEDLKEKEALILGAEEKMIDLEYQLFIELREQVKAYTVELKRIARRIAELDCLQNFSQVAMKNDYVRPTFNKRKLQLTDSRHPVVEKVMSKEEYVPNDCHLDDDQYIDLITGPNMSGKSTYMRQVALISIMAQMGSFVPCAAAEMPIFDQIFTRIGAADDLVSGQSTFMVEMLEARNALKNATADSLIIFDEIGRGTSTYDGLSLAQAMIEYVHDHIKAKTLFSTHYHELVQLEDTLPALENIHVAAKEYNGELIFLHKIMPGAVENSYGIHVARLADLPAEVISRASAILDQFEKTESNVQPVKTEQVREPQMSFDLFGSSVEEELKQLDIARMTPIEALLKLQALQDQLK